MNKEALKQEAREWIIKNSKEFITNPDYSSFDYAEVIYIASAKPREKRIAELEAQIEKMKCCENCKKFVLGKICKTPCIKYDKWEIKENERSNIK